MRKDSEIAVKDTAGQVYGGTRSIFLTFNTQFTDTMMTVAGADSTLSAVLTFILAMMHYPEVQRKAQAELDRVLHHEGRLPGYEDQPDLPYITAVMKEVLRWKPVAPMGTPCTVDLS